MEPLGICLLIYAFYLIFRKPLSTNHHTEINSINFATIEADCEKEHRRKYFKKSFELKNKKRFRKKMQKMKEYHFKKYCN